MPARVLASTGITVLVLVAALLALGAAMVALAVWLVRSTRKDPPALGPLEAMGDRPFRRADATDQAARLATARPQGAPEPAPAVPWHAADDAADVPDVAEPEATEISEPSAPIPAPLAHSSLEVEVDDEGDDDDAHQVTGEFEQAPPTPAALVSDDELAEGDQAQERVEKAR